MRIIAGAYRGRKILGPADEKTTRPITDRVRENVFNRLNSLGMLEPPPPEEGAEQGTGSSSGGWSVLDIFSGTGTLGIEALSRGAAHCTFVDQDRDAVARLEDNLATLDAAEKAHVVHGSALGGYWLNTLAHPPVRLAFVDPPYAMVEQDEGRDSVLALVARLLPVLEEGGVVVVRTPREIELPEVEGMDGPGTANYGTMRVHFYQSPLDEG